VDAVRRGIFPKAKEDQLKRLMHIYNERDRPALEGGDADHKQ